MIKKDYLLISLGVLVFIILAFATFKFWQSDRLKTTKVVPPYKFSDNSAINTVMQKVIKIDDKTKIAVPANNEKFSVNYYPDAKNFTVVIKVKPYETVKSEAVQWFKTQGFREDDFCFLKVTFLAVKGVKDNFESKDAVFNGCPVPSPVVKVTPPPGQILQPIVPSK